MIIHDSDTVAVALRDIAAGERIEIGAISMLVRDPIPHGHEFALRNHAQGDLVLKYGYPICHAKVAIGPGEHVHSHNLATSLNAEVEVSYRHS